jgi:LuxR family maltose regulon positive regulatory protein
VVVEFARGDVEKAIKCIAAIKHPEIKPSLLPIFPISEDDLLSAQIKLGDMSQVEHWLATKSFEVSHEADFEREGESVLLARVLVRQGQADKALNVISPLLLRAEQEGHQTLAIELLVLQAMARQSQGKTRLAIVSLERALNAAKLEQHIRVFLDEGAPMAALLKHALAGRQSEYAQILLQQMSNEPAKNQTNDLPVEPLSHKERKTLALLVAGLTNKEIAEQLFVSPNTIKTHVKNIYRKLGVNSRVEAVAKGAGFVNPA